MPSGAARAPGPGHTQATQRARARSDIQVHAVTNKTMVSQASRFHKERARSDGSQETEETEFQGFDGSFRIGTPGVALPRSFVRSF